MKGEITKKKIQPASHGISLAVAHMHARNGNTSPAAQRSTEVTHHSPAPQAGGRTRASQAGKAR
jgi:hypothetical protein